KDIEEIRLSPIINVEQGPGADVSHPHRSNVQETILTQEPTLNELGPSNELEPVE
ncbi:hypothetical protein HAX54_029025, partial [Datura stramonium]|nr:hypothetical protein [Datura stramonium]